MLIPHEFPEVAVYQIGGGRGWLDLGTVSRYKIPFLDLSGRLPSASNSRCNSLLNQVDMVVFMCFAILKARPNGGVFLVQHCVFP